MERPVPWPTVVAAVASLVVLSTGPLYRLRTWWDYEDPLATDATVVVLNAAVGLVALSWLVSQGRFRQLDQRALAVAAALVGWLLLGSLWSLDRLETFRQALQIATALTIGAAIAAALGAVWFRWALWAALQVGLGWSVVAIYLDRSGTIDSNGDWAGIFFNRNSLALYAALALLVAVFIAADARSIESAPRRWSVVAVLVAFGIVDVRLIAGSDALTPVVALGVALAAVGLCAAGRHLVRREVDAERLAAVVGGVALAVAAVGWATRHSWLDNLGRRADLTGRLDLWNVALDWAWRRPLHGYGYMAAWSDPTLPWPRWRRPGAGCEGSAHNSFVDMFLGAGTDRAGPDRRVRRRPLLADGARGAARRAPGHALSGRAARVRRRREPHRDAARRQPTDRRPARITAVASPRTRVGGRGQRRGGGTGRRGKRHVRRAGGALADGSAPPSATARAAARSSISRCIASASAASSAIGTTKPFTPSATTSVGPRQSLVITASPAASASLAAIEKLSRAIDGITSTSAAPSTAAVCDGGYGGSNRTRRSRHGLTPDGRGTPYIVSRQPRRRRRRRAAASITSRPFSGWSPPT